MSRSVFGRFDQHLGHFGVRPIEPHADAELVHSWVTAPKAAFWLMQEATVPDVARHYAALAASPFHEAFIGLHEGRPTFLVERYDPAHEQIGKTYAVKRGDTGMHFLVAPTDTPVQGFTRAVIVTVMELLFSDPLVHRVVVEPDVRNHGVQALNAAVGFRVLATVSLPDKRALLSACTKAQYLASPARRAA